MARQIGLWSFALGGPCYTYWRPYTHSHCYGEDDYDYVVHDYTHSHCYGDDDYDYVDHDKMKMAPCKFDSSAM